MRKRQLETFGKFAILLAGPIIWGTHFTLVYGAASLELTLVKEVGLPSRLFIGLATLASLALIGWIAWSVRSGRLPHWESPQEDLTSLWRRGTFYFCLLSFIAVLWQALPAILLPVETSSHASPP